LATHGSCRAPPDNRFFQMARPLSFFSTKTPRFLIVALCLLSAPALAQTADVAFTVTPAELKIIANALDAPKMRAQTQPLVIKLQEQVDLQFPAGPYATELPLPAIRGLDR
jgi:hypothetical protein